MAYAPATRDLRTMLAVDAEARRSGMPHDEVLGEAQERAGNDASRRMDRREFLQRGALTGAAIAAGASVLRPSRSEAASGPRVAIVGSGLAGIHCAYHLWNHSGGHRLAATIYEAETTHVGGRCWTLRNYFSDGLIGEHGGAFINHDQWEIRSLASKLGLRLENVGGGDLPTGQDIYWFDGDRYTYPEANRDWQDIGQDIFRQANRAAPYPQLYGRSNREGRRLDGLSVPEWLEETGIGVSTTFGRLLLSNAVSEYGGDPGDQSALNLIYTLDVRNHWLNLVNYDEKFHIVGGNDQLITRMLHKMPPHTVKQDHALVAIAERWNGSYRLTFDVGSGSKDVIADHVVLALPFSALRDVDVSRAGFTPLKRHAIAEMGMGQNAKIHVELRKKTWPRVGGAGTAYVDDTGFCVAWDDSVPLGMHGAPALLLGYPGGSIGRDTLTGAAHGRAPRRDVDWFLDQIEPIYPGTKAAYTGTAYEDHWSRDPWHRGAYSYYRVGQSTGFGGYEKRQQGKVHFAGEQTDPNQQGFLNGAVRSGQRAAIEILKQV